MFRLAQCERRIEREGILIRGYRGSLVKNPAGAIANQYRAPVQSWFARFGLSPSDRRRVAAAARSSNPLEEARQKLRGMIQ